MIRVGFVLLALTGCTARPSIAPRSPLLRDITGYAAASCLTAQQVPYLQDQGYGWGSIAMHRVPGVDIEPLLALSAAVKVAVAKGHPYVIHDESSPTGDAEMPLAYCAEIIDNPEVRAAMQKAATELEPAYEKAAKTKEER